MHDIGAPQVGSLAAIANQDPDELRIKRHFIEIHQRSLKSANVDIGDQSDGQGG